MNIFIISLITVAILEGIVILFFINKGFHEENEEKREINLPELLEDIDFNKNIFFSLLNKNVEKYDLNEIEDFLSLDSRLMNKIKENKIKKETIKKYNEFIVSSFETLGTVYFDLTEAKDFIENLMYT